MKQLLFSGALCAGWGFAAHAQGLGTWIEQLAALQTLEQTIRQGYTTVSKGLGSIGDIRADEYQLHLDYYGGLSAVNPTVVDDPKTAALTTLILQLVQRLNAELYYWRSLSPIDQP